MDEAVPEVAYCMAAPQYQAEHHALSTTFAVKQKKTIPSDGSDHKVTIVSLDLEPILHFDCVPSKSTNVYLTASMLNTSSYPLLSGTASVYVDNSFSTKVSVFHVNLQPSLLLSGGHQTRVYGREVRLLAGRRSDRQGHVQAGPQVPATSEFFVAAINSTGGDCRREC